MLRVAAMRTLAERANLRFASTHGAACCDAASKAEWAGRHATPQQPTSLYDFASQPPTAHLHCGPAAAFRHHSGLLCLRSASATGSAGAQQLSRMFSAASGGGPGLGTDPVSVVESDARACWRCGATVPRVSFFFCDLGCNVIQPAAKNADLFLLLDLAPGFDVDLGRLEASYKQLQRRLHPDKYSTASPEEKEFSEEQSSLVSTAVAKLRHPLKRAIYLLERAGKLEAGTGGEGMSADDPLLLARVMEVREQIEDAKDDAELQELREENSARRAQQLKALSEAFAAGDLESALDMTVRLKYTERIREAIEKRAGA